MPAPLKLALALALLIAILVLVLGVYMNVLAVQLSCFAALSLLLLILRGVKSWLSGYRMMLPFLISLILVYVLFGILRIRTQEGEPGSVIHWLDFGLKRIMLFANSVLAFQLFFQLVSFDDLLRLPLKIDTLKYVILGKILYANALNSYEDISFHQRLIPGEQREKPGLLHRFRVRLSAVLALLLTLSRESRLRGEQIDNRIASCHAGKSGGTGQWHLILGFVVLVAIATMIIPIPVPGGGFFNFGDVMIVFIGLWAGRKAGAIAGGIGSAIADLLLFPLFAPITLIVKGLEGYICGLGHQRSGLWQFLFPLAGSILIVVGYFIGEWSLPQLGKAVAIADLPVNVVQAAVGFLGGRALFEAARYLDL
ncbi:MAG: ECF transporter S component [Candidatus Cloacimonetes bacterium]|nr:ECF transporter S component [Candidatus Cloacimonadota bacterium]